MKKTNLALKALPKFPVLIYLTVVVVYMLQSCTSGDSGFHAGNLRCEYIINPLGIDSPNPRLTWQMIDERKGAFQSAYQVFVSEDSTDIPGKNGGAWNSGKIKSGKNLVSYNGISLQPFTRYYWRVIIWDHNGRKSSPSPYATFETGMIDKINWQGTWISDSRDPDKKPAPYFRKTFQISKKVVSARQYIAVAGLFELYINGVKAGDHTIDPAYTRFDRRNI